MEEAASEIVDNVQNDSHEADWPFTLLLVLLLIMLITGIVAFWFLNQAVSTFIHEPGMSGVSGAAGVAGETGISGISGSSGGQGFSGVSGQPGSFGPRGASGASGVSGPSGFNSVLRGPSGASGISGVSGISGGLGLGSLKAFAAVANDWVPSPFYLAWYQTGVAGANFYPPLPSTLPTSYVFDGTDDLKATYGVTPRSNANDLGYMTTYPNSSGLSGPTEAIRQLWTGSYLSWNSNTFSTADSVGGYACYPPGLLTVKTTTNDYDTIFFADDSTVSGVYRLKIAIGGTLHSAASILLDDVELLSGSPLVYSSATFYSDPATSPVNPTTFTNNMGLTSDFQINRLTSISVPATNFGENYIQFLDKSSDGVAGTAKLSTYFRSKTFISQPISGSSGPGYLAQTEDAVFQYLLRIEPGSTHTLRVFYQTNTGVSNLWNPKPLPPSQSRDVPQQVEPSRATLTLLKINDIT